MRVYDMIVIGFGKGGKTLAANVASTGKKVAVIEKDEKRYGGTCINIACIPTKTLIQAVEDGADFDEAYSYRDEVTDKLRNKNYHNLADQELIDVYDGLATFKEDKVISVKAENSEFELTADTIIINTGTLPQLPDIEGIKQTAGIFDSTSLQTLRVQPKTLGIIGAGNIGLEFASLYAQLGTQVYLFNRSEGILRKEEPELAELAYEYLQEDGVEFVNNFTTHRLSTDKEGKVIVEGSDQTFAVDALLIATGRKANTEGLGVENTNIALDDKGFMKVGDDLQTTVEGVYALGDINGGPQFTYISLDDFRIVKSQLLKDGSYKLADRKNVCHTHFLNPPLAAVGLTEAMAKEKGLGVKTNILDVSAMPRAHVNGDLRGRFKVVLDEKGEKILGASLMGRSAEELINLIKMAIDNNIPASYLKNQVFTHPSMAENFNDLFNLD